MVQAGTFHLTNAIPGDYDVTVVFSDGTRVEIDDGFNVPFKGVASLHPIDVYGGLISGKLLDSNENPLTGEVQLSILDEENSTSQGECSEVMYAPCHITPDENGSFTFGPVVPGSYLAELDMDGDGFNEAQIIHIFEAESDSVMEFPTPIPTTYDLTFTLSRLSLIHI